MNNQPSQDRTAKRDQRQLLVLLAALGDKFPGAIEAAVRDLPLSARRYLGEAVEQASELLREHPRAAAELADVMDEVAG